VASDVFEPTSRYCGVDDAALVVTLPDGSTRTVSYKRRRFIAAPSSLPALEHISIEGERPDLLANRFFGEPTQFWRLCDANRVIRPAELTETAGRRLSVPVVGL
jgi:hypothetical protein